MASSSIPVPELSQQPFYEIREARLPFGVYIAYRQEYQTGIVDLLIVAPAGSPMIDRGDAPDGEASQRFGYVGGVRKRNEP